MNIYDQIVNEKGVDQEKLYLILRHRISKILYKIFEERIPKCSLDFEDLVHSYYIDLYGKGSVPFEGILNIRQKQSFLSYLIRGFDHFLINYYKSGRQCYRSEIRFCKTYLTEEDLVELSEADIKRFAYCYSILMSRLDPWKEILLTRWLIHAASGQNTGSTTDFDTSTYRVNTFRVKRKFLALVKNPITTLVDLDQYHTELRDKIINDFNNIDLTLMDHLNHIENNVQPHHRNHLSQLRA